VEYIALLDGVNVFIKFPGLTIDIFTNSLSAVNYLKYHLQSTALTVKISNIISKVNT